MIDRYTRRGMALIWGSWGTQQRWLDVEIAACEIRARNGEIPAESMEVIKRAVVNPGRVAHLEQITHHELIAFLQSIGEQIGDDSAYLHQGLTSSDVIDTALALQIRDAGDLLLAALWNLCGDVLALAEEHSGTPCVGRTHGVHAEPITFGLKLLGFHGELRRNVFRLQDALAGACVGKLSGAVGTCAHIPPQWEELICTLLGVGIERTATQVVARDRHAHLVSVMALIATGLDRFATELRNLARTEIREVEEGFGERQKGSSAMPHKKNPWRLENVSGLARVMRGYAVTTLENVVLWHERDLSNSSVERVVLPDAFAVLDFMVLRFTDILETLVINTDRMTENLGATRNLVYSGALLVALMSKAVPRDVAYEIVQDDARLCWEFGYDFEARVREDPRITNHIPRDELDDVFSLEHTLRNVDEVFARTMLVAEDEMRGNKWDRTVERWEKAMARWGEIAKIAPEPVWDDAVRVTKACIAKSLGDTHGFNYDHVMRIEVENPYTLGGKDGGSDVPAAQREPDSSGGS